MPRYTFASKNSRNKRIMVVDCLIAELDKVIEDNKNNWVLIPSAPAIVSGVMGKQSKPDPWFRDKLKEIKKKLPKRYKSNINTF